MKMKFSVICSTYNRSKSLRKSLLAISEFRYPAHLFEVVVTDDGSSDDTEEVVNEIKQKYFDSKKICLKFIANKDVGFTLAANRNRGVSISSNDYLLFIDDDIIAQENTLEEVVKTYHICGEDILVHGFVSHFFDDSILEHPDDEFIKNYKSMLPNEVFLAADKSVQFDRRQVLYNDYHRTNLWVKCGMEFTVIYRKAFNELGGFDEDFVGYGLEDIDFTHRACLHGMEIVFNGKMTAIHIDQPILVERDRERERHLNIQRFERNIFWRIYSKKLKGEKIAALSPEEIYIYNKIAGEYKSLNPERIIEERVAKKLG